MSKDKIVHSFNNQGFTLLELMVAAGVFVVGLVLFMQSIVSIHTLSKISEEEAIVDARMASLMDDIYRMSNTSKPRELLLGYTPKTFIGPPAIDVSVEYLVDGSLISPPPLGDTIVLPNPMEVHVGISALMSSGHTYTSSMVTKIITNHEGGV